MLEKTEILLSGLTGHSAVRQTSGPPGSGSLGPSPVSLSINQLLQQRVLHTVRDVTLSHQICCCYFFFLKNKNLGGIVRSGSFKYYSKVF